MGQDCPSQPQIGPQWLQRLTLELGRHASGLVPQGGPESPKVTKNLPKVTENYQKFTENDHFLQKMTKNLQKMTIFYRK